MNKNLLFFLSFLYSFGFSQNVPWMNFNDTNSQMPSNQVNAIAIDPQGIKWIAAEKGFVKFDNINWAVYNKSNSALFCPHPLGVAIDQQGIKWISTYCQGLVKFDGTNFTPYDTLGSPSTSIAIDKNNNKWVGTSSNGLAKFDGANWTFYKMTNSPLPSNYIKSIAIDPQNNKWFGTANGLVKFDDLNWTTYNISNSGLPDNNILTIAIDDNNNKWIGTNEGGLAKFNNNVWTIYDTLNSGLHCNSVYSIAIENQYILWIGTCHGGLHKFDGTNWIVYNISNSGLPGNWTTYVAIEPNGNKWIGLHDYGLSTFNADGVLLPVELTNFTSSIQDRDILLQWNTATEINSNIFEVERKTSGIQWNKISIIKATGNSTTPRSYSYFDRGLNKGEYFYRVKIIDLDGKFKYSKETAIKLTFEEYLLNQNYPNPFNPASRISFSLSKATYTTLKVYDVMGREIQTIVNGILSKGEHAYQFDGKNLAGGVYFYTLNAENQRSTRKMILMK